MTGPLYAAPQRWAQGLVPARLGKCLWKESLAGVVCSALPRPLEPRGRLPGQGAVNCLPALRDLLLWPTPSAVGHPAPSCLPLPAPSLVKVLTPSERLRFCKNKDKHRGQAEAKATTVWEQALG